MTHWRTQAAAATGTSSLGHPRRISPEVVTDAGDLSGVGAFMSSQSSHRPQVYVHVEFGVSWTSRHIPNHHELTYKSRGLRNSLANYPREAPAPLTKNLSSSMPPILQPGHRALFDEIANSRRHDQQKRAERHAMWETLENQRRREVQLQSRQRGKPAQSHHHQQGQQQQYQKQLQPLPWPQQQEPQLSQMYLSNRYESSRELTPVSEEQRSSRSSRDTRSTHERGHSAPPPMSGTSWDIEAVGDVSGLPVSQDGSRYAVPPSLVAGPPREFVHEPVHVWKDLPTLPTRYRLGEGLPWSQGLPEPAADPDDERLRPRSQPESGDSSSVHQPLDYTPFRPFSNRPTVIPIQVEDTEAQRQHDIEAQRKRNLEALSTAMMTVDNGFESQWWNQGPRDNIHTLSLTAPALPPSVWPSGMSSSALPVSLVLPPSLQGDSDSEEQRPSTADPTSSTPQRTSSLPSSPTTPRRIRVASLGWAIASSPPVSTEPAGAAFFPSPMSTVAPSRNQRVGSTATRRASQHVVSAVSEYSESDLWSPDTWSRRLSRSRMSASDELFLPTGRYA
ncbi:MAG: hypothetical protein STHCBS139747_002802 [Sporothrix thermara]